MSSFVSETTVAEAPASKGGKHDSADSHNALPHAHEVHELARQLSRVATLQRTKSRTAYDGDIELSPFDEDNPDKRLDPNSPEFDVRTWVRSLFQLESRDPERYPKRTAGVSFTNLNVFGFGSATDYQKTVSNVALSLLAEAGRIFGSSEKLRKIKILRDFEGLVESGEMLLVLGRPGSGCTTFLKTLACKTHGFYLEEGSNLQYQGIDAKTMGRDFRGEVIYNAETEVHFPQLSVGQTLSFAARARAPRNRPLGVSREQYAEHLRDVVMAVLGLSHTVDTRVGNDYMRGVSGGERKRVSIAECILSRSPVQMWDNSTRGLDSASALEFVKTLRLSCETTGSMACVSLYQASQDSYDVFDKVIVLYAGHEIYFGRCDTAKEFFTSRGYVCPARQTTADFLTSLTNPTEREVAPGWEHKVPKSPEEFAKVWKESPERAQLLADIQAYEANYPVGGENLQKFRESRSAAQAKHMSTKDPHTISFPMQVRLCTVRGLQRLNADKANTFITVFGMWGMGFIASSIFYNLADNSASFYSRSALIYFAVMMNAFSSALEILAQYAQRPIVEKHTQFALYHPSAEAVSSMLCDLPSKIAVCICFNLTLYFLANLNRSAGPVFFFLLIMFTATLVMSSIFRTIAAISKTLQQALAPGAVIMIGLVTYVGFALPTSSMHGWSRWMNYLDPLSYAYEALMVNEQVPQSRVPIEVELNARLRFHGRYFPCISFVPSGDGYQNITGTERSCSTVGAVAGSSVVSGESYLNLTYNYFHGHKWRDFGLLIVFWVGFTVIYLLCVEFISAARSKGEVLVFRRGHAPSHLKAADDEEAALDTAAHREAGNSEEKLNIHRQTATFHWENVCYDVSIKGKDRRILDHVDGWVRPGTLTALMGASGAGKTTLLDVLANRVTMGVVQGAFLIDGQSRDRSFQRKTGYCMQQDLHLETATVRESLAFSALCRQPKTTSRQDKLEYVEEVIRILEMEDYACAIVGVPGEGLNVEQRKRLTIGVELVAKPDLLLFLDEPSSGLDSQTAWSMVKLCRKLADNGQAILCTIHQPSAILFAEFDRLLFLQKGGRTVYFGDIGGPTCSTLVDYFEKHGADPIDPVANPAEWMLAVIGAAPGSHTTIDWHGTWRNSEEYRSVRSKLDEMKAGDRKVVESLEASSSDDEFAMPFVSQLWYCLLRVWDQYWRTPSYIYAKLSLCTATSMFIGFTFFSESNTAQGLQNEMFSIFLLVMTFGPLCQQLMPLFCTQRALYEARERPSKTYSWQAFLMAQILVELPWQTLVSVLTYFTWYYPIGLYRNAEPTHAVTERGGLMFLLIWVFFLFSSTFAHMVIAAIEIADIGGTLSVFAFALTLIFCGVLATPAEFPHFWIFMYRVSPFTYLISAMLTTAVTDAPLHCSIVSLVHLTPPSGQTCAKYLGPYLTATGGTLYEDAQSTTDCYLCTASTTNAFLEQLGMSFDDAWRNFGILWAYVLFNVVAATALYWSFRVPKNAGAKVLKAE